MVFRCETTPAQIGVYFVEVLLFSSAFVRCSGMCCSVSHTLVLFEWLIERFVRVWCKLVWVCMNIPGVKQIPRSLDAVRGVAVTTDGIYC